MNAEMKSEMKIKIKTPAVGALNLNLDRVRN